MCWQQHQTEERGREAWFWIFGMVEGSNNIFENTKTAFISHRGLFYKPGTHMHAIHTHHHKNGECFWVSMTCFPESVFCHIPLSVLRAVFLSLILSFGHISPLAACVLFCVCVFRGESSGHLEKLIFDPMCKGKEWVQLASLQTSSLHSLIHDVCAQQHTHNDGFLHMPGWHFSWHDDKCQDQVLFYRKIVKTF